MLEIHFEHPSISTLSFVFLKYSIVYQPSRNMAERNDSKMGESAAIKRLISLLPAMPLIEGVEIHNLTDIRAFDEVAFSLVMSFFCENVRTKKERGSFPKATLMIKRKSFQKLGGKKQIKAKKKMLENLTSQEFAKVLKEMKDDDEETIVSEYLQ